MGNEGQPEKKEREKDRVSKEEAKKKQRSMRRKKIDKVLTPSIFCCCQRLGQEKDSRSRRPSVPGTRRDRKLGTHGYKLRKLPTNKTMGVPSA